MGTGSTYPALPTKGPTYCQFFFNMKLPRKWETKCSPDVLKKYIPNLLPIGLLKLRGSYKLGAYNILIFLRVLSVCDGTPWHPTLLWAYPQAATPRNLTMATEGRYLRLPPVVGRIKAVGTAPRLKGISDYTQGG